MQHRLRSSLPRSPHLLAALALAAGCLAGCTAPASTVALGYASLPIVAPSVPAIPAHAELVPMRRLGSWTHSGLRRPQQLVIRNGVTWRAFWRELGDAARPPIAFSQEFVLAAALGNRRSDGYTVRIERVLRDAPDRLIVEVVTVAPDAGCRTSGAATQPVDVVALAGPAPAGVRFVERRELRPCD